MRWAASDVSHFFTSRLTFQTLAVSLFVVVGAWGLGVVVALSCFCFLFCKCFGIPNSPRILDLDDRQGLIASSAMQKKKIIIIKKKGNYLLGEQATSGGFLPIFWDAPSAYMHAATDLGTAIDWLQRQVTLSSDENGCLAVLHSRNKMVASQSECGPVQERYILCKHDRPLRSLGTNKGRISQWWWEQAYERTPGPGSA